MPDSVLRGYVYSRSEARYRDVRTGRFVARSRITQLMESQVNSAEDRLGRIIQEMHAKEIAPGYAQTLMRDELRRLHLQNRALSVGGFDRLSFADYGAIGGRLRDDYRRMTQLINDVANGRASLPQALNRVNGYIGNARIQFFEGERNTQRQAAQSQGSVLLMIRDLGTAEHCRSCVDYHQRGWQFDLPNPGEQSECSTHCRCGLRFRQATIDEAGELIGTRR